MAINDVMGLTLDLSANTDKFVKDLQKAAGDVSLDFDMKPLIKRFKSRQSDLQKTFADTIAQAATLGFSRAKIDKLAKKLEPLGDSIEASMKKVFRLQRDVIEAQEKGLDDRIKKERKAALEREQDKLSALKKRFDFEKKSTDQILENRKRAVQEAERLASRTRSEAAEDFAKSLQSAFSDLQSGNVGGILKGAGRGLEARGAGMQAKAAAGSGKVSKMMAGMGRAMAALGPAIAAIGALAAGLAAIVSIAVAADSAMKDVHRSFFQAGGSAGMLAKDYGTVAAGMAHLRDTFIKSGSAFNQMWGTTAKDHLEILGAYESAGLTLRELQDGARNAKSEMDALRQSTQAAIMYANLLGTSNVEMATNMAAYMEDLGMTIDGVQQSLSGVHLAAKESGFGVKRFFNMVLQATSGMSMYNVRLEEAGGLLIRLGNILGSKMGGDFLAQLTKGFGDESMQDRYRRVMTTGTGKTQATFGRSAVNTAQDFLGKLGGDTSGLAQAASKAGIKIDPSSAEALAQSLGRLNQKEQTRFLAEARQTMSPELVRQLTNLTGVALGAGGGTGAMAQNLGSLDMGGKMMMQLQQGMSVIGKPLHEMTTVQLMAFENLTGTSGEQLEQLRRVSQAMYGNFDTLKAIQSSGIEPTPWEKEQQVKAYGAYVENGQIIGAKLDDQGRIDKDSQKVLGDDIGSYIQSQGDVFQKAAEDSRPEDIKLATQQVEATVSMSKILEQGIEWVLNEIYKVVSSIWGWLKAPTASGRTASAAAESSRAAESIQAQDERMRLEARIEKMQKEGASPEEIARLTGQKKTATLQGAVADSLARKSREVNPETLGFMDRAVARAGEDLFGWQAQNKGEGGIAREAMQNMSADELRQAYRAAGLDPEATAQRFSSLSPSQVSAVYASQMGYTGSQPFGGRAAEELVASGQARGLGTRDFRREDVARATGTRLDQEMDRARAGNFKLDERQALMLGAGYTDPSVFQDLLYKGTRDVFPSSVMGDISHNNSFVTGGEGARLKPLTADEVDQGLGGVVKAVETAARVSDDEADKRFRAGGPGAKGIGEEVGQRVGEQLDRKEKERQVTDLFNALNKAGVRTSYSQAERWQSNLAAGQMPAGLQAHLGAEVSEGQTLQDVLRDRSLYGGQKANDFLMHVSSTGRVKFAQRIDGQDTVAVAAKSGGGISQAASHKGGGGTTIIQHIYAGDEAARKGFRTLANARVLG